MPIHTLSMGIFFLLSPRACLAGQKVASDHAGFRLV